jgi:putative ABC transport system ATP-binding protein
MNHKPHELSGGEQQRVGHRARDSESSGNLACRAADWEPGHRASRAVMTVLRDLNKRLGQTMLVITHDPEVASYANCILYMRDGLIETQS